MRPLDTSSMHLLTVAVRQQQQTFTEETFTSINSWHALVRHSWLSAILQIIHERQQAIASALHGGEPAALFNAREKIYPGSVFQLGTASESSNPA